MASSVTQVSAYSATSSFYPSTVGEGSHIHKETFEDRIKQWRQWLAGSDIDGRLFIMGRAVRDWVFLIIGYTIFYASLIVMGVAFMAVFYWVIDWNYPRVQLPNSILQTPGLSFRPQPNIGSTLVYLLKGDGATYIHHLDHIDAYLRYYENEKQQGENYIDCSEIRGRRTKDFNKVCRFDIIDLGPNCVKQQNYGFDDGLPCVLVKINKVFGWMPEEYTNETVPEAIQDLWNQWWITITCEGETATDKENVGEIVYFPSNGFHFKYFPFRNQQGYRSPLVFVRFNGPHPGILLMIQCKVWAHNIAHDLHEQTGVLHFELLVD
ncbi:hypothetical protein C0Q70_20953 [Pomacea canaliculata]|uniref:Sodium/potassium-transporting ATPase subunit beta n=1 Tax=Pomacea canaliculata TaxID=400727 RepID=A0A2T7NB56_POMCA|nr:sodium/potassium-transporting ATPase subunit beta-2-like [Pomacea canaliculata]PVD18404.1 hypothetical protein C0Q70_20953 [Pomacea canaliculata]